MHEDDHHTPAHKPQDLASALAALHERCSKLLKSSVSKPTDAQKELDQTRDIASWLPELAADSDLSRAEWDRINEHSKKLLQSLEELARGGSADPDPRVSQRLEIELHALDDIVGRHPELFGKGSAIERANSKDNTQYVEHPRT
ncbi:MAG TPA: hypothetical protein VGP63_02410 [Planctomycetaceae bacterium]|nr:hypothetical protein [Planctomycetaceae bacterium]